MAVALKKPVSEVTALADDTTSSAVSEEQKTLTRRVILTANLTAKQLADGTAVPFTGGAAAFRPAAVEDGLDYSKGIVQKITVNSLSSNYDEPVHMAMNLFNGRLVSDEGKYQNPLKLSNETGWLYTPSSHDFGMTGEAGKQGFTNLLTILPNESARLSQVVYKPDNVINNRYIEQYGGYTMSSVRNGIVPFPGKDYYYVPHDHVIMSICRNNWDSLGINSDLELKREGEYLKVKDTVVNQVVDALNTQILSQLPFTQFEDLAVQYQAPKSAHAADTDTFKIVSELKVDYMFPNIQQ